MTDPTSIPAPVPTPPAARPVAVPFERGELKHTLYLPFRMLEVVLSERGRLVQNIVGNRHLGLLSVVMLLGSVLFALPYGLVLGWDRSWHVVALFVGSMAICFPSLQVFSAYLGVTISILQNLALALIITAAAALFCFGFFPIYWFLEATMPADAVVTPGQISVALLTVSLIGGLSQLNRCVFLDRALQKLRSSPLLLLLWQALFLFITYRMAVVLGIL